jgi:hypothetical protein
MPKDVIGPVRVGQLFIELVLDIGARKRQFNTNYATTVETGADT